MKFETLMLKSLFTACMLMCLLTVASMVTAHSPTPTVTVGPITVVSVAS